MGVECDFAGVAENSALRSASLIYVDELLRAVEIGVELQQKIDEMAVALVQA
jgi:hypothetical protein